MSPPWYPSSLNVANSLLKKFAKNIIHTDYHDLHEWSINHIPEFWDRVWDFCGVVGNKGETILENAKDLEKAVFFPNATLNFAQNLLRQRNDHIAISFIAEDKVKRQLTHEELYWVAAKVADHFKQWGITKGDRVAGYLPNMPETVAAMLLTLNWMLNDLLF